MNLIFVSRESSRMHFMLLLKCLILDSDKLLLSLEVIFFLSCYDLYIVLRT
jgi:hypothetical protein